MNECDKMEWERDGNLKLLYMENYFLRSISRIFHALAIPDLLLNYYAWKISLRKEVLQELSMH